MRPLPLSLTGSPITTSSDPNGSAPSALATTWMTPSHAATGVDASTIFLSLADGTSATIQLWIWAGSGTEWHKLGAAVALAATRTLSSGVAVPAGGHTLFPQVTAVAGSPTLLRAGFWGLP